MNGAMAMTMMALANFSETSSKKTLSGADLWDTPVLWSWLLADL